MSLIHYSISQGQFKSGLGNLECDLGNLECGLGNLHYQLCHIIINCVIVLTCPLSITVSIRANLRVVLEILSAILEILSVVLEIYIINCVILSILLLLKCNFKFSATRNLSQCIRILQ